MIKERVKIIDALYQEQNDCLIWDVVFLDSGRSQKLSIDCSNFLDSLNIMSDLPRKHVSDFCFNIKGKEVNLVIEDMQYDDLGDSHSHIPQEQWTPYKDPHQSVEFIGKAVEDFFETSED